MKTVIGLAALIIVFAFCFSWAVIYLRDTEKNKGGVGAGIVLAIAFFVGFVICYVILDALNMIVK